jgi:hypothetical protein
MLALGLRVMLLDSRIYRAHLMQRLTLQAEADTSSEEVSMWQGYTREVSRTHIKRMRLSMEDD